MYLYIIVHLITSTHCDASTVHLYFTSLEGIIVTLSELLTRFQVVLVFLIGEIYVQWTKK